MNTGQPRHASLPAMIATAILVAFSAIGLMAGSLAFKITDGSSARAHIPPAASPTSGTPTATSTISPAPTAAPSSAITQPFRLDLSAMQNPIRPGQPLTITILASDSFTHTPIVGLACSLEDPEDGGTPLLRTWPNPTVTNADGQATWTIELPQTPPGIYEIGFSATGTHGYRYHGQISISVVSGS